MTYMFAAYLPLLLSALAFIVVVISFLYLKSYIRVRTSQERLLSELREEVDSILKSINETTDRDISLIEEREKNLKNLLEEIEKRLKVYVREVRVRRETEDAYRELGKNRFRFHQASRSEADSLRESASLRESEALSEGVQQNQPGDSREADPQAKANPAFRIPEFEIKSEVPPGPLPESPPSIGEQIRSLVSAGFPVPVIASRLGISIAEVEFAAAILERRGSP